MALSAVMDSIEAAEGPGSVPTDVNSERFQLILRMVRRTVDAAIEKCRREIGVGRISGMREFKNKVKTMLVDEAISSGKGATGAGVSKSAAYRALSRKRASK